MSDLDVSQKLLQVLDENGVHLDDAETLDQSAEELLELFRMLKLARPHGERAINLQRQGRMGTYSPIAGQEPDHVASAMALKAEEDPPSHRADIASRIQGIGL